MQFHGWTIRIPEGTNYTLWNDPFREGIAVDYDDERLVVFRAPEADNFHIVAARECRIIINEKSKIIVINRA